MAFNKFHEIVKLFETNDIYDRLCEEQNLQMHKMLNINIKNKRNNN